MRLSALFAPTLRDDPAEAEIASHRLLLRAAFVRQVAAGVYTTLPLGLRSIHKIERIVREEMDASGAQEFRMPILLPAEPWKATGRWDLYGDTLFRLKDRHQREMLLGPTQEEVVTQLVAADLPSYRDLPVNLYQIEWKYRDEFRPRFGLLRGREFLMKDAYTFDRDEEGMAASYDVMLRAYRRVFDRCGLTYIVVDAEPGQIGGDGAAPLEKVYTPDSATIDAVSELLDVPADRTLKTMLFDAGGETVAVLLPGDREVEEAKIERLLFPTPVRRFEDADFTARGFAKGYVGPGGLGQDVTILADHSVRGGSDWVTGANEPDHHVTGANVPRDFRVDRFEDVVALREGDRCPLDGGELRIGRSIVVGHIYQLGTRYSAPLRATFVDEDGSERLYQMGSHGIGTSCVLAAAVEQFHDEMGLRLPKALAPFEVVVVLANRDQERVVAEAEHLYRELLDAGVDAALDDRDQTAGVKFADADLIGCPVQVVIGKRGVEAGTADLKLRATGERSQAPLAGASGAAMDLLATA